jgi:hypothetical protein
MRAFPQIPDVADAPAGLLDGHLWLQEWVEGAPLRVQLASSGLLVFGDDERVFDEPPLGYRCAVRYVRDQFDRAVLRAALDDVESAVFYGVATRKRTLDYDWARLPPFLGFDVYDAGEDRFLPPDAVDRLYDRLGLASLNAVQKELRGADFDPDSYDRPESAWRDGRAAGVLVRNKTGDRAKLSAAPAERRTVTPFEGDPADIATELVTAGRVERASEHVTSGGSDALAERVLELAAREEYARLLGPAASVDLEALRSAVGERTRRILNDP